MALNPYLFIGVGGTGGKTIGVIRETLLAAVKSLGMPALPRGWQFLHIDVPTDPDTRTEGLPSSLPRSQYVGLAAKTSTFSNMSLGVSSSLESSGRDRYLAWDCWRPYPPEAVKVNITKGAGQFRGIGRVASQHGLRMIDAGIARALSIITDPLTGGELSDIQRARGARHIDAVSNNLNVMVIGSIGGGSGSGLLLDVCEVVRSQGVDSLSATVFTPEVFASPSGRMDSGIAPNSFFAINELSNAMWTIAYPGESSRDSLFARAGLSRASGFGGPAAVFLVGRSSGTVTLSEPNEVYAVVGHSLANVALDEELSNQLDAYVLANMKARTTGLPDRLGLSASTKRDLALFSALGFGRVSLGRDYFDRYASERLLRLSVERLLDRHLQLHQQGDGMTDEQVLLKAADNVWTSFVNASGINEEGDDHNDIVNALDPLQRLESELASFENQLTARLGAAAGGKKIATATARAEASKSVFDNKEAETGILAKARVIRASKVPVWAAEVANTLRENIVATAAQEGLPVTRELVDRLIDHSQRGIAEIEDVDLKRETEKLRSRQQFLNSGTLAEAKNVRAGDPLLSLIANRSRQILESEIKVQTLTVVAAVFTDLVENLLKPWQRALTNADELLRAQARPAERRSPLDRMPGSKGVPEHLHPSRVEYLLDDIDAFPQMFVEQIGYSAGEDVDVASGEGLDNAVEEVVSQVIRAQRLNPLGQPVKRPSTYEQAWIPAVGAKRTPARAQIKTAFAMTDLEQRVFAWLHDDRKQVGRHLTEDLAKYLAHSNLSDSESLSRQDRLVNRYAAALKVAAPLAKLDATLVQAIHNQDDPALWLRMSPLSVPDSLPELRARLEDVTTAVIGSGATPSFTTESTQGATILTALDNPYHPLEFTSIMEPISAQWMAGRDNPDFWLWRRTGPLPEWVPLSPNSLACLLRGWFMARFLGRAAFVSLPEGGYFEVFVPGNNGGSWTNMNVRGVRPTTRNDHVANLVEALPLQMIEAFHAHSLAPLEPFQALIELGATLGTERDPLRRWVSTGKGIVDPERTYCPASTDRRHDLTEICEKLVVNYTRRSQEDDLIDTSIAQTSPRHELLAQIIEALTALKASATGVANSEEDDLL